MSSNVHIVNSVNASNLNAAQPVLHDGSVVKGRVVFFNGGNDYTVSIAGQKINVQSRVHLETGSVFSARLSVEGNLLTIKLLNEAGEPEVFSKIDGKSFSVQDKAVVNLLNSLGLPVTFESLKLVQFALELGIKPGSPKLLKALVRSKNDDNTVDEEKAQAALLLDDKKIKVTDRAVDKITGRTGNQSGQKNGNDSNQQKNNEKQDKKIVDSLNKNAGTITAQDVKNYFDSLKVAAENQNSGELTLFNSIKGEESDGQWMVLPFEWSYKNFRGVIRVLFSYSEKCLKKIVLNCQNTMIRTKFVLNLKGNQINSIKFGLDGKTPAISKEKLKSQFVSFFDQTGLKIDSNKIEVVPFEEITGFACEYNSIPVVDFKV